MEGGHTLYRYRPRWLTVSTWAGFGSLKREFVMNHKSNAKKAGKSLKEKRADKAEKRARNTEHASAVENAITGKKKR